MKIHVMAGLSTAGWIHGRMNACRARLKQISNRVQRSRDRKRSALFPQFPVALSYFHIDYSSQRNNWKFRHTPPLLSFPVHYVKYYKSSSWAVLFTSGMVTLYELLVKTGGLSLTSEILTMTGMLRRRPLSRLVHETCLTTDSRMIELG